MPKELSARCLCGATMLVIRGEPRFAIACYCTDCARVSGTGHAVQVGFDRDAVTASGALRTYRRLADSGNPLEFGFCGECGSPVTKTTERAPALSFVYAGALDDASIVPEPKPVFEDSRQPWDT